jgi:hypothetical protein
MFMLVSFLVVHVFTLQPFGCVNHGVETVPQFLFCHKFILAKSYNKVFQADRRDQLL